jgi:hypothetical protein
VAVQRVLRNTNATLEVTFYVAGVATDADAAVTVDITRADGTVFATGAATSHPGVGRYTYTLAPQTNLEYFTLVWSGAFTAVTQKITTHTEIVGAFYAPLSDIRAMKGLANVTDFPNAALEEARQWFEDFAEGFCGRAFVPRFARDKLDGDTTDTIRLNHIEPRTILTCKIAGVTQTGLTTWSLYPTGKIVRDAGSFDEGFRNVEIQYEYGADEPDLELREAALRAIQYRLLGDHLGLPAEAMSAAVDVRGPFSLLGPGGAGTGLAGNRPTGIPEVDVVVMARRMVVGVG